MASEPSRSNSTADSYIGSLISLTSKSEIRYEGVLYNINTEESSIGLKNVRSFGTERRKKDGPQVPGSDKIYEYILFRGGDIKDLQVKSSPPVQTTPSINHDPAIIQSHYPRSSSTPTNIPSSISASLPLPDLSCLPPQMGHPGSVSNFQNGLPLYQPNGNIGSWGPSPSPNANGNGLAMPMYWQGYYPPPNGVPHMHQQSLLRPPPGLSMPHSFQQPMQYPGFNSSLPSGSSNMLGLAEFSPLLPASTTSPNLSSPFLPSNLLPVPSDNQANETLTSLTPNKVLNIVPSALTLKPSFPSLPPLNTSGLDVSDFAPPISSLPNGVPAMSLPFQAISQSIPSICGTFGSTLIEASEPSLITPDQLLQPGPPAISLSHSSQTVHKDVEVVQIPSPLLEEKSVPILKDAQPPILPLPVPARASQNQKFNGAPIQNCQNYRSRERGRECGSSHAVAKFSEEFDFMAMNDKFNKDEVWGHLGKNNKSNSKDKEEDGNLSGEEFQDEGTEHAKPVYNKDDFFDSLSSNALDRKTYNSRPKFSEQMKLDTETFGEFVRNGRGGRGGRGFNRGGSRGGTYNTRGHGYGYSGRGYGYGYSGRGRGWDMPNCSR